MSTTITMSAKSQVTQSMINDYHLEVRDKRPGGALQVQGREDELIEGAALLVNQIQQLPIICPGLELAGKQAKGGVLINLDPELEVLPEPHHVRGVAAEPPDHPHPHPGGRGSVGHHVGPCWLERNPKTETLSSEFPKFCAMRKITIPSISTQLHMAHLLTMGLCHSAH